MLYSEFKDFTGGLSQDQKTSLQTDLGIITSVENLQSQITSNDGEISAIMSYLSYFVVGVLSCDPITEGTSSFTISIKLKVATADGLDIGVILGSLSNTSGISVIVNSPVGNATVSIHRQFEIDAYVITSDWSLETGAFVNGDTITINFDTLALNGVALDGAELVVTVGA